MRISWKREKGEKEGRELPQAIKESEKREKGRK